MKKSKLTGEKLAYAMHQAELGLTLAEVCRKMGISEATFYRSKQFYAVWDHPSYARCASRIGEPKAQATDC